MTITSTVACRDCVWIEIVKVNSDKLRRDGDQRLCVGGRFDSGKEVTKVCKN